tara:strand:- start:12277 stop:12741 length:465 start_codon:yes stop_codon:yes gene_type:complete
MYETTDTKKLSHDIRFKAMNLLARREHSRYELQRKLLQREYPLDLIASELDKLEQENLLSDERYVEAYINMRKNRGFGPLRIKEELREKGVSAILVDQYMSADIDWNTQARGVRERKFGEELPNDFPSCAKQMRFLQYRGYDAEQINQAIGSHA